MKEKLLEEKVETLFETLKKHHRKNTKVQCPAFENEPIHINTIYGIIIRKIGKQGNKHLYSIIPNWKGYIPRVEASEHKIKIQ